jgi:hypothetical protein
MNGIRVRTATQISIKADALRQYDQQLYDGWQRSRIPVGRPDPIPIITHPD